MSVKLSIKYLRLAISSGERRERLGNRGVPIITFVCVFEFIIYLMYKYIHNDESRVNSNNKIAI